MNNMKYSAFFLIIILYMWLFASCDDMYSIHEKYLNEKETVYIGYPDIISGNGGYERIQLIWKLNADPKIDECCIYWNNRADSLSVPVDRTDSIMSQILPLPEGKYLLEMVNKSKKGHRSLTSTISGESFGEKYQEGLYNRLVTNQVANQDSIILHWSLEEGCVGIDMNYINQNNQRKEVFVKSEQTTLILKDYVPGGYFTYSSLYLPEINAIDTISALEVTLQFKSY